MKKAIGLLLICLLAFATVASATQTRVLTMGNVGHILKDDANVGLLPQTLLLYPDQMTAEKNVGDFNTIGGHCGIGSSVLGLYFTNIDWVNAYAPAVPDQWGGTHPGADQKIDLFWAKMMGEIPFGLNFFLFGDSYSADYPNNQTATSTMGFGVNLGVTFAENLELSLGFDTFTWTDEDSAGNKVTEPSGNMDIAFFGRYWMEQSEVYTLVPYAGFAMMNMGSKVGDAESTSKTMSINLGLGNNIHASDNILAVTDIGIDYAPTTTEVGDTETKATYSSIPYFRLGLEGYVSEKVDVRMGAVKEWSGKSTEDNDGNTKKWGWADTDFYLGAGLHFGNLDIDLNVDQGFITRGPYLLTGSVGDWATMASVRYRWGE